jgi:hypothetical protein
MIGTTLRKTRFGAIATAALLLATASGYALSQKQTAAADARLQELADLAALAGVNALAGSEGQSDAKRLEAANAAVYQVAAARSDVKPIVFPSLDDLKVSVALTTSNTGKGVAFTATARYVQPGSALSPDKTAEAVARKRTRG